MLFLGVILCREELSAQVTPPVRPTTIIVVGAGGAPQYDAAFAEWADRWVAAAKRADHDVVLIGRSSEDSAETDRDRLRTVLETAGKSSGIELWLIMIGHGTFDRREAKFNLRGPDISAQDLAGFLKGVNRPAAIVNTASASAPFLGALSASNRVVIVATKSGSEQNFARFGDFMSQSISDPAADLDKDDQTSLWEAYLLASRRTAEFYSTDGRLQTEHPLLDDTGDGQGVRAEQFRGLAPLEKSHDGKPLDGQRAHQWHLLRNPADRSLSPEVLQKRNALELSVLQLRERKLNMPREEYLQELERLLVELAELNASLEVGAAVESK